MSSNIGPEAQAAYKKYLDASSIDEKIKIGDIDRNSEIRLRKGKKKYAIIKVK